MTFGQDGGRVSLPGYSESAAGLFEANLLIQHEKDGSEIFYLGVGNSPIQFDSQNDFIAHPAPLSPRQVGQLMWDG